MWPGGMYSPNVKHLGYLFIFLFLLLPPSLSSSDEFCDCDQMLLSLLRRPSLSTQRLWEEDMLFCWILLCFQIFFIVLDCVSSWSKHEIKYYKCENSSVLAPLLAILEKCVSPSHTIMNYSPRAHTAEYMCVVFF